MEIAVLHLKTNINSHQHSVLRSSSRRQSDFFVNMLCLAFVLTSMIYSGEGFLRYSVYICPIILLANGVILGLPASRTFSTLLLAYFGCIAWSFFLSKYATNLPVIMLWQYFGLVFAYNTRHSQLETFIFLFCVLIFQFYETLNGSFGDVVVDFFNSDVAGETHTIPFVSGLLLAYFLSRKNKYGIFISLFIILLSGKRIVLGGALFGIALYFVDATVFWKINRVVRTIFYIVLGLAFFFVNMYIPDIYRFVADEFDLNINMFTAGRYLGQEAAYKYLMYQGWDTLLLGNGLGTADRFAAIAWNSDYFLIHNDYLRLALDFGIAPSIIVIMFYIILCLHAKCGPYLIGYIFILWFTDNTIIYPFFQAILVYVIFGCINQRRRIKHENPASTQ